jgi:hypothetical protein
MNRLARVCFSYEKESNMERREEEQNSEQRLNYDHFDVDWDNYFCEEVS